VEEIEIEYKTLLTKEQFSDILHRYPFPKEPVVQTNHYFETKNFALKQKAAALRIREIAGKYVITLKEAKTDHVLETHDTIDKETFIAWKNDQITFANASGDALKRLGIKAEELRYVGSLTTTRYSFTKADVTYCLDKSTYANQVDYELEIEEASPGEAKSIFDKIVTQSKVTNIVSETKIARFFKAIE